ncbi:SMP-30/gluconolactonase/LRE family protein, partial [Enterococcus faecium]
MKSSKLSWVPECSGFLLACLLAFNLQIFFLSTPVSSASLDLPITGTMEGLIKLGEGFVKKPEDMTVDSNGLLYTATKDGWIKRMYKNETWENWKFLNSSTLLGMAITKENDLVVCDSAYGLFKVNDESTTILANGLSFPNDVIAASDDTLYFTIASSKYTPLQYYVDLVEGKPNGQLMKYDPSTKEVSVVIDGFYFANGIALSKDEDYVIVCESWKFRCRKYWLEGEKKGQLEIFIDNLPGGPDNINIAPDGNFWISLIKMNATGVQALQNCSENKILLAAYPELIGLLIPMGITAPATAVKVTTDGEIIMEYSDPNAT